MLYGNTDIMKNGIDFGIGSATRNEEPGGSGTRGGFGGGEEGGGRGIAGARGQASRPSVELPNYILQISRDRLRAVSIFSERAIEKVRPNLGTKEEVLAKGTVSELKSLLRDVNVGLVDVDQKKVSAEEIEAQDRDRRSSYAFQMTEIGQKSAVELEKLLTDFTTEQP